VHRGAEFREVHRYAGERPSTDLVLQLVEAAATASKVVASVAVHSGFVVERGS
jgi:hypothetical protein